MYKNTLLSVGATIVSVLVWIIFQIMNPIMSVHAFFSSKKKNEYNDFKHNKAVARDILWNVKLAPLLNWIFYHPNMYKFGKYTDTVSEACGYNILAGNNNKHFVNFYRFVDKLFLKLFKEQNHCLNSVKHREVGA